LASGLAALVLGAFLAGIILGARTLASRQRFELATATSNRRLWSSLLAGYGLVWLTLATGEAEMSSAGGETLSFLATLVSAVWWGTLAAESRRRRTQEDTSP
jgi:hypothetical protein